MIDEEVEALDGLQGFVNRIVKRDESWREHAACRDATIAQRQMLLAPWKGSITIDGERMSGRAAQAIAVEMLCRTCLVQWECAYWRVRVLATEEDDTPGVYGLTVEAANWLVEQGDAAHSIIVTSRRRLEPVSVSVDRQRGLLRAG